MSNATTGFNQSTYSSPTQRSSMPMNTYSYALEEMTCSDKEYHKKHHFHKPYPEEYGSKAK